MNTRNITTVKYETKPGRLGGSLSLQDLSEFARTLESIGEGRLLDGGLGGDPREGVYVIGDIRQPAQQAADATSASDFVANTAMLRKIEDLHGRLERIRAHYDQWHANQIGQVELREQVENELSAPEPAGAVGTSREMRESFVRLGQRWVGGEIDAVHALRAICVGLGIDLHPETKGDDEEDDDF